jgi:hypothetical protein
MRKLPTQHHDKRAHHTEKHAATITTRANTLPWLWNSKVHGSARQHAHRHTAASARVTSHRSGNVRKRHNGRGRAARAAPSIE